MAVRTRLGWKAARFWIADNANGLGVPLSIVAFVALIVAMWFAIRPSGALEDAEGRIVGVGFEEIEGRGSVGVSSVVVGGQTVSVETPVRYECRIGDRISLQRRKMRWGYAYLVGYSSQPCRRP